MLIFANLSIFFLYKIEAIPRTIATAYKLMEPHLESKHLSGKNCLHMGTCSNILVVCVNRWDTIGQNFRKRISKTLEGAVKYDQMTKTQRDKTQTRGQNARGN